MAQSRENLYITMHMQIHFFVNFIHIYDIFHKCLLLKGVHPVVCCDWNIKSSSTTTTTATTVGTTNFIFAIKRYMFRPIKVIIRLIQNVLKEYSCIAKNEISLLYQIYLIFIRHLKKSTLNLKQFKMGRTGRRRWSISMVNWSTGSLCCLFFTACIKLCGRWSTVLLHHADVSPFSVSVF